MYAEMYQKGETVWPKLLCVKPTLKLSVSAAVDVKVVISGKTDPAVIAKVPI